MQIKNLAMATAVFVAGLAGAAMLQAQFQTASNIASVVSSTSSSSAKDPGVRAGSVGAGTPLPGLTSPEMQFFQDGLARFVSVDSVSGTEPGAQDGGLGPAFNSNSCSSCHSQPAIGGTSPSASQYPSIGANPQILAASDYGATNSIPYFITSDGPVREARFPFMVNSNGTLSSTPDGGVHDLFTIAGRQDARGCSMAQPNYEAMEQLNNIVFRIPTPLFGSGLIDNIPDAAILANMQANAALKKALGISGHPNYSGNDGTITKFGWKAQNKSLEIFAGEAYNVEMGITNELFMNERGPAPAACLGNQTPEDETNYEGSGADVPSDVVAFADFMRFLAPPAPSVKGIPGNPSALSIADGLAMFAAVHCDTCHAPLLQTATKPTTSSALANKPAALFSDLLVHHMGSGLSDRISQGSAGADEFRTAPLWGLGQRIFFLHDGRATPANGGLMNAIQAHASAGSEANQVIGLFNRLSPQQQQDLLNFLRSL
ncbi:MAG: di-heme oxidoredictase family protein [Candidatus Acidiferrales bacterium]